MEERIGDAFAGTKQLTVIGRRLHPGGTAPDFCLNYLDLVDMAVHTVRLSDSVGMVRLLSVVNSLTYNTKKKGADLCLSLLYATHATPSQHWRPSASG